MELINDLNYCSLELSCDPAILKNLAFRAGKNIENLFLILCSVFEGKAYVICYISKKLTESTSLNAQDVVKNLGHYIDGSGGGQSFFATTTGKNVSGIRNVITKSKQLVAN